MDKTSRDHDQLCWVLDWLAADHDIEQVPVALLLPGDSPRLKGESKAETQLMVDAVNVPPIIVHQATMQVIDGWRRVTAATVRHQATIAVRYFNGTAHEAFVLAVAANTSHGLPLTPKDRKAAAARILDMYPDWSDRAIATAAGLSHPTVAGIRRKRSGGKSFHLNRRLGRDGKTYPPRSNPGRQAAAELIRADQNASMREVTRQVGVSVGTAHDARPQLRQSVEPMVPTTHGAGLDFHLARAKAVLQRLWNNPAVRSPQKAMLELLSHSLRTASEAQAASRNAPEHCRDAVAEFASAQSDSWSRVAQDLRTRTQTG
jgi:ParB-like chromosome segregation protein Spo0J